VGPLQILRDTLEHFPLGHPFGSLTSTVADYGILNGAAAGSSLDNGFYVIVFYYGWLGVVLSVVLLAWAVGKLVRASRYVGYGPAIVAIWAVGTLFFSGGIMLPEYLFTLWLLFSGGGRRDDHRIHERLDVEPATTLHRDRYLQGPQWPRSNARIR
jgi:putative colanic acid polymerase